MSESFSSTELSTISSSVEQFLASPPFHACLLLVHFETTKISYAADYLSDRHDILALSVGGILAESLLKVVPRKRSRQAIHLFTDILKETRSGPIICKDIDLLFEPSLKLDPLRLMLDVSRHVTLIVAWPGSYDGKLLAYAVPEHAHYRVWTEPDLCDYCAIAL